MRLIKLASISKVSGLLNRGIDFGDNLIDCVVMIDSSMSRDAEEFYYDV